jgi:hypothetical protein
VLDRGLVTLQNNIVNFNPYFLQYPEPIPNDPVDAFMRLAQQNNDGTHLAGNYDGITPDILDCLTQKYYVGVLSFLPMR